jgi:hypothetical protein
MANFEKCHPKVMRMEGGGWSDLVSDLGGETYRGVTKKYHPGWKGWKIIDRMKTEPGFPGSAEESSELGRLVSLFFPEVPRNPRSLAASCRSFTLRSGG